MPCQLACRFHYCSFFFHVVHVGYSRWNHLHIWLTFGEIDKNRSQMAAILKSKMAAMKIFKSNGNNWFSDSEPLKLFKNENVTNLPKIGTNLKIWTHGTCLP